VKKLAIAFAAGLLIGLGATSAAVGFRGAEPEPLPERWASITGQSPEARRVETTNAAPDAAALADVADSEAAEPGEATGGERSIALSEDEQVTPQGSGLGGAVDGLLVPAEGVAAAPGRVEGEPLERAKLAKLFGSMQPREAARVLEHLDDTEVQVILAQLGTREAASILSNLRPERAAGISRSVLRGERNTQ
jgi:hypothetical protein